MCCVVFYILTFIFLYVIQIPMHIIMQTYIHIHICIVGKMHRRNFCHITSSYACHCFNCWNLQVKKWLFGSEGRIAFPNRHCTLFLNSCISSKGGSVHFSLFFKVFSLLQFVIRVVILFLRDWANYKINSIANQMWERPAKLQGRRWVFQQLFQVQVFSGRKWARNCRGFAIPKEIVVRGSGLFREVLIRIRNLSQRLMMRYLFSFTVVCLLWYQLLMFCLCTVF